MLEKIAKYHSDWVLYVGKICEDKHYVEDIVQEMYLKIERKNCYEKIIQGDKLNKGYVCSILKNMVSDYYRAKSKVVKVDYLQTFEEDFKTEGTPIEQIHEIHEQHLEVCKTLRQNHTYYERLFLMYTDAENPSYQDIANLSGISKATIYNGVKRIKQILQNETNGTMQDRF